MVGILKRLSRQTSRQKRLAGQRRREAAEVTAEGVNHAKLAKAEERRFALFPGALPNIQRRGLHRYPKWRVLVVSPDAARTGQ